jgi:hypothetical protein
MIEEEYQKKLALEAENEIIQLNNSLKTIRKNI